MCSPKGISLYFKAKIFLASDNNFFSGAKENGNLYSYLGRIQLKKIILTILVQNNYIQHNISLLKYIITTNTFKYFIA